MTHMWFPTEFPRGIIIFQGVLVNFNFLMKFPHLEKNCWFNERPKIWALKHFSLGGQRVKLNFRNRYRKPNIYSKNSSHYQVFSSNSQKLSLWCRKKNHYPPRWICMTHIWFPTEFPRGIIIFQGVLAKFNFLMKFPHLEKNCWFNERPKIWALKHFSLGGRVKHNFRNRYRKSNIYSKNSSHYQVFSSNSQKLSLWCRKKNHYPPRWICMTHIWFPTEFPRGIIIFQGVLKKFNFLMKFPHLEKNCWFNERPKIWALKHFSLGGEGQT